MVLVDQKFTNFFVQRKINRSW